MHSPKYKASHREQTFRRGPQRFLGTVALAAVCGLVVTLAGAPVPGFGADHLDAPGLTPPSARFDADINDVYVFEGSDPDRTAVAVTTHPAAGVFSPLGYATDLLYKINVDQDGDAVEDLAWVVRFGPVSGNGTQIYRVRQYVGDDAQDLQHGVTVGRGRTGQIGSLRNGGSVFAGLRSDPFFFDLSAFRDDVLGQPMGRDFCDQGGPAGIDFFEPLNTNAIVIEVADDLIGGDIGVWASTHERDGTQLERMGRPAINTVFNSGGQKNLFNTSHPSDDVANFTANVTNVLSAFSALDTEGAYTTAEVGTLASVLLPDVITYDTTTAAAGPLNGRALADDVIDVELNIVTGGFPFDGRDGTGAITTDCVQPHGDYSAAFPYLGSPNV